MKAKFTCLLIDDDSDDQEIFLSIIDEVAPDVVCATARNGQDALKKLAEEGFKPDLIFVDLNMPLMNGKEFLSECRQVAGCKDIPVVILTTTSDKRSIDETRKLGAVNYITKPDRFSGWADVIRQTLETFGWQTDHK